MTKNSNRHNENGRFWNFIDNIEGDKVVWVIVFMLIIFSVLAIFSSTSLLKEGSKDRMDFIKDHIVIVGVGLGLIAGLYNIKRIGIFRMLSQLGFVLSFMLLLLLDLHVKIPGIVEAEYINHAWSQASVLLRTAIEQVSKLVVLTSNPNLIDSFVELKNLADSYIWSHPSYEQYNPNRLSLFSTY